MKPKRRLPKTTLKTLSPQQIAQAVRTFCQLYPNPQTRGRPRQYPEELILTLALIQTRFQASYRDLLFCYAPLAFPDLPLPALGTLVYRFQQLILRAQDRLNPLQAWLARMGMALETPTTETPYAMVDGTGIGYATPFDAPFRRGAEIRRLRSHGKAVVVSYWQGGYCWVVGTALGKPYADEGVLWRDWLERSGLGGLPSGTLVVGDGLYGHRAQVLALAERLGWCPVARVREGLWNRVRSSSRLRARARGEQYPEVLRGRYRIEQVFGSVKGAYGSYVGSRSWWGAALRMWGMWVLWNMVGLLRVGGVEVWGLLKSGSLFVWVMWVRGFFEHPHHNLLNPVLGNDLRDVVYRAQP